MGLPKGFVNVYCLKHGNSMLGKRTAEYRAWEAMKRRCLNPKSKDFADYGARGITVCDLWRYSFEEFLADVGPKASRRHSIHRIDNDGDYRPGNVRWATANEQSRNSRHNVMLTFHGQTMCVSAWAEKVGLKAHTIELRVKNGWSHERALTTPVPA